MLLVDDYSSIRTLLRVVLEDEGYRTSEASNATDAIESVLKMKPDLIILDLMMPQIDGRYVIEHLRQSGNETPIIVLTAKTEGLDAVMDLVGALNVYNKPFDQRRLLARIQELIGEATKPTESPWKGPRPRS